MEALVYPSFPELRQWLQQAPGFKGHHWVAICFVHPIHSCGNAGLEVCLVAQLVAESAGSDPVGLELVGQTVHLWLLEVCSSVALALPLSLKALCG